MSRDEVFVDCDGVEPRYESSVRELAESVMSGREPVVTRAAAHSQFSDNPLVRGHIGSLAGAPLISTDGTCLGALLVASADPQDFNVDVLGCIALIVERELTSSDGMPPEAAEPIGDPLDSAVLDTVAAGVVVIDRGGTILRSNATARDLAGAGPGGSSSRISDFVPVEILQDLAAHFLDPGSADTSDTRITRIRRADGSSATVEMTTTAFFENGDVRYVAVFRDAAERPESVRVESATRQRESMRLVQHEVRGAAFGISAYSELIRDSDLSEVEVREFANTIHQEALRVARICDDMILITELVRPASAKSSTDLIALCRERIEHRRFVDPRHHYRFESSHDSVRMHVDADRIVQALDNLLANAAKYSDEDTTVVLDVTATFQQVSLSVRDHGWGIGADELPLIFDSGFRTQAAIRTEGSGLGLTLVKQLAELHGGTVNVESELGKGSTFTVALPRRQD